jgi:hypothetical protein
MLVEEFADDQPSVGDQDSGRLFQNLLGIGDLAENGD